MFLVHTSPYIILETVSTARVAIYLVLPWIPTATTMSDLKRVSGYFIKLNWMDWPKKPNSIIRKLHANGGTWVWSFISFLSKQFAKWASCPGQEVLVTTAAKFCPGHTRQSPSPASRPPSHRQLPLQTNRGWFPRWYHKTRGVSWLGSSNSQFSFSPGYLSAPQKIWKSDVKHDSSSCAQTTPQFSRKASLYWFLCALQEASNCR